ncbi:MAG: YitT family protein, partial [Bacteroidetes bacterium]|nr:YitT family protein [Bacteroidota bacterium]
MSRGSITKRILKLFIPRSRLHKSNNYSVAKELFELKVSATHLVKDSFLLITGIIFAGFGLESFLLPNSFIDGGVTGISLLTAKISNYPLPLLIILINIPFIILGYTQIGKPFAIKSILAITGLALAISFIPYPVITSDKLLVAVFGGFFLGMGIGFAVRGGGVLDG